MDVNRQLHVGTIRGGPGFPGGDIVIKEKEGAEGKFMKIYQRDAQSGLTKGLFRLWDKVAGNTNLSALAEAKFSDKAREHTDLLQEKLLNIKSEPGGINVKGGKTKSVTGEALLCEIAALNPLLPKLQIAADSSPKKSAGLSSRPLISEEQRVILIDAIQNTKFDAGIDTDMFKWLINRAATNEITYDELKTLIYVPPKIISQVMNSETIAENNGGGFYIEFMQSAMERLDHLSAERQGFFEGFSPELMDGLSEFYENYFNPDHSAQIGVGYLEWVVHNFSFGHTDQSGLSQIRFALESIIRKVQISRNEKGTADEILKSLNFSMVGLKLLDFLLLNNVDEEYSLPHIGAKTSPTLEKSAKWLSEVSQAVSGTTLKHDIDPKYVDKFKKFFSDFSVSASGIASPEDLKAFEAMIPAMSDPAADRVVDFDKDVLSELAPAFRALVRRYHLTPRDIHSPLFGVMPALTRKLVNLEWEN